MATFNLGLTMAGAISAGAYTGGVLDFLFEVLDAWESQKKKLRESGVPKDEWDVPSHDVTLPVITGASAGGITGALALLALSEKAAPISRQYRQVGTVKATMPRLYRAWVELPRFVATGDDPELLGTDDLESKGAVNSLLDTTLLDKIVDESFLGFTSLHAPRAYLADKMHLYLTETNLRGVPYGIRFTNAGGLEQGYDMMCHADHLHFAVGGAGEAKFASTWADVDPDIALDLATLRGLGGTVTGDWRILADAALGTGAFPAGLSARALNGMTVDHYNRRQWTVAGQFTGGPKGKKRFDLLPALPKALAADIKTEMPYVAVDGGVINNEPFELARWALMDEPPEKNVRDPKQADRAVIMIDPFPAAPDFDQTLSLNADLASVIGGLFPALKNQARFKADDLADALDETVFSRFLIAPRRKEKQGGPPARHAIACGLLGGFGGFLDEEFRAHDYQLGRLNCYLFLRDSLALPLDNKVLAEGYGAKARTNEEFQTTSGVAGDPAVFHQIIPVPRSMKPAIPAKWPQTDRETVETMVKKAVARGDALVAVARRTTKSRALKLALQLGWWMKGKSLAEDFIRWAVLKDLIRRGQIAVTGGPLSDTQRQVLACLADPAYAFRTAKGIVRDLAKSHISLTEDAAAAALRELEDLDLAYQGAEHDGAPSYTHAERKPGWLRRTPGIGFLYEKLWAGAPSVD